MDIKSILRLYDKRKSWHQLRKLIIENQEEAMNYIKKYYKCDENIAKEFYYVFSKLGMLDKD